MVPPPTTATDPVSAPPRAPETEVERPSSGLLFADPQTEVAGGGSVAGVVEPNFQEQVVWGPPNFDFPIAVEFASDGRAFVAEQGGMIKVFDGLEDSTPSTYANLTANVHRHWDRGLLGMALDPDFASNGRMYVAYTYGRPLGGATPTWGDECPTPPGSNTDGCVVSGRLSVLTNGGSEQVLINDWCQQFPSHSMSDIVFDAEGALIVAGGDGASFEFFDYGQAGGSPDSPTPRNPCGDPPGGVGGAMTVPSAQGGALRSQDIRTTSDSLGLSGSIIRINRFTGAPMPDNPNGGASGHAGRIIAYGVRNPFRMVVHPVTGELWFGDVGWNTWEEINRVDPDGTTVRNFGWPCREGSAVQPSYDDLSLCQSMTGSINPHFQYSHAAEVVPGDGCVLSGSSISAMAFYEGGTYPAEYDNALFFGDYSRKCIWVMISNTNGPNPNDVRLFAEDAPWPVNLTVGPGGDLFYVGAGGSVRRIVYLGAGNSAPVAAIDADPEFGPSPLTVDFDASASSDPDGDGLSYAWDFGDNDGQFNDAFSTAPTHAYGDNGTYQARVRVNDGHGGIDIAMVQIDVGNTPPIAQIDEPSTSLRWSVGEEIDFSGSAIDPDGALPASAFSWELIIAHCGTGCHEHPIDTFAGVREGTFNAPDHEYPSHLILRLTVEDGGGASDTAEIEILPKTVTLQIRSVPSGLNLTAGSQTRATPFNLTAISGSAIQLNAPTGQLVDGFPCEWASWSNGGPKAQLVHPTSSATYTATFNGCFTDVPPGAPFRADIAWLVVNAITSGCDVGLYCPTAPVTRGQMASFLVRTLGLTSGGSPDQFTDIASSTHRIAINRLATAGITAGCTTTKFCPNQVVTRAQMAAFLARALELTGPAPDAFGDDDGMTHESSINLIAQAGVTTGCAPDRFCPSSPVTRGQMAAFLHRAFEDLFPD